MRLPLFELKSQTYSPVKSQHSDISQKYLSLNYCVQNENKMTQQDSYDLLFK